MRPEEEIRASIEQEFFKTFEIDMKEHIDYECTCIQWQPINCTKEDMIDCSSCEKHKYLKYPKITAEIVLKLEEVVNTHPYQANWYKYDNEQYYRYVCYGYIGKFYSGLGIETRTEALLSLCIQLKDQIKEVVQEVLA